VTSELPLSISATRLVGVGHELDRDRLEGRLAAPVGRVGLEPEEGVALELVDHVGAGADGRGLEAFRADALVIGLRQHIAGEEAHPLEEASARSSSTSPVILLPSI
jgi:hypothetical protein